MKLDLDAAARQVARDLPEGPDRRRCIGMKQQIAVLATYTDGTRPRRDRRGVHRKQQHRGRHRRQDRPGDGGPPRRGDHAGPLRRGLRRHHASSSWATAPASPGSNAPVYNYIDELVYEKLKQVKVLPSELCTDAEFIRRVYLDLTGLPPEPDDGAGVPRRHAGRRRSKRDELIDKLVGSAGLRRALDEQVGRPACR